MTEPPTPEARARARVSLADVAERAGVSPATVSRSLRGGAKVSAETLQRVLDAARELSYAVPLRSGEFGTESRRTVAVIVPFIERWFFSTATAAAAGELRRHGFDVLLYHLGSAEVRDHFFATMPLAGRVSGVLSLSMPLTERHTLAMRALGMPLVSIGSHVPGFASVGIDDENAARSAVNHLLNLGHRRIGFVAGVPDDDRFDFKVSPGRRLGYQRALASAGVEVDPRWIVSGPHGLHGGTAAMTDLLSRPELPTAVLAEYDEMAIGALRALQMSGMRVPEDVSVVGIDDHEVSEFVDLTTVAQPVELQGRTAARMLVDSIVAGPEFEAGLDDAGPDGADPDEAGPDGGRPVQLPTRLVLRGSTAPMRSRPASGRRLGG